mmetsp:Transcript_4953/g.10564  ORF Transcript_4953/g.10564 Transcript_4953/m.10564 type:complete len:243 (-) Transcript_4953:6472-7200(-)
MDARVERLDLAAPSSHLNHPQHLQFHVKGQPLNEPLLEVAFRLNEIMNEMHPKFLVPRGDREQILDHNRKLMRLAGILHFPVVNRVFDFFLIRQGVQEEAGVMVIVKHRAVDQDPALVQFGPHVAHEIERMPTTVVPCPRLQVFRGTFLSQNVHPELMHQPPEDALFFEAVADQQLERTEIDTLVCNGVHCVCFNLRFQSELNGRIRGRRPQGTEKRVIRLCGRKAQTGRKGNGGVCDREER